MRRRCTCGKSVKESEHNINEIFGYLCRDSSSFHHSQILYVGFFSTVVFHRVRDSAYVLMRNSPRRYKIIFRIAITEGLIRTVFTPSSEQKGYSLKTEASGIRPVWVIWFGQGAPRIRESRRQITIFCRSKHGSFAKPFPWASSPFYFLFPGLLSKKVVLLGPF